MTVLIGHLKSLYRILALFSVVSSCITTSRSPPNSLELALICFSNTLLWIRFGEASPMSSSHNPMRYPSVLVLLCLAMALLMAGCSYPWQHPSAAMHNMPKPTTQQLLNAMRNSFRNVSAFHVVMRVQNAGRTTGSQFQIRNADGDIIMPDKIKAQATVILSGQSVTVNL